MLNLEMIDATYLEQRNIKTINEAIDALIADFKALGGMDSKSIRHSQYYYDTYNELDSLCDEDPTLSMYINKTVNFETSMEVLRKASEPDNAKLQRMKGELK